MQYIPSDAPFDSPAESLYTSPEFLEVIARVYFPTQVWEVRDYAVDGKVFRLLKLDRQGPVVRQTFIDMHEPLSAHADPAGLPRLRRLDDVGHAPVPVDRYLSNPDLRAGLGAPTLMWTEFPSWEHYRARQGRRFAEDRRRARQLEVLHGGFVYLDDDTSADVLPTCMAWKSARDVEAQRPNVFGDTANRRFFGELRSRGLLRASTLRAGSTLVAVSLGAVHGQRWTGWVCAFNPDDALRKYSPGRQLLHRMLESSFRAGHREFDFSIGMDAYKLDFATHVRPVASVGAAPAGERLVAAGRSLLRRHPSWAARARTLKGWLRPARA